MSSLELSTEAAWTSFFWILKDVMYWKIVRGGAGGEKTPREEVQGVQKNRVKAVLMG